jgi:PAS domain S-box-containing protein
MRAGGIDLSFDNKSWRGWFALIVTVGFAYFLAARLGLVLRAKPGNVAVFWPAAGVAIGALIALGPKARVPVALAVAIATIVSKLVITGNPWLAVTFAIVCVGQTVLTPWLLEYWFGRAFKLDDVPQVLGFIVASTAGAAFAGLGAAVAVSLTPSVASAIDVWRIWFVSCLLGTITVAPLVVGLGAALRDPPTRSELIEGAIGLTTLAILDVLLLSLPQETWATALPVGVVFPVLLWIAVRCRPVFAAAAAFVVALTVIWSATFHVGHFGDVSQPISDRILAAQTLVMTGALIVLILAALFSERNRNETALKVNNERLHLALSGASLGAFNVDVATGRLECDARAAFIHGHHTPPRTLLEARRFVHSEDLRNVDAAFAKARRGGGVWNAEYRVIHPLDHPHAGETRWVAVEGSFLRNAQGAAVCSLGITHDITTRKLAERALVERNAQLALAGKAALVGSFTFDVRSGRMEVSPGYVAIHGLPEGTEETSRGEWRARVHPEDLPRLQSSLRSDVESQRAEHHCDYRIIRSSGEVRWIEARSLISYDRNGDPLQLVGANIDVTERKNADLTLAERNMQLALAGKSTLVGSFAYDVDTEIMQISEGYAAIHGFPAGTTELSRSQCLADVHGDDIERVEQSRRQCFAARRQEYSVEYRITRPDGAMRWVETRCFISYEGDRPQRVLGVSIDITERKRSEDQQRALIAELDHRVKNVLSTVVAIIAQTQEGHGASPDFTAALESRIKALARTHELLSQNRWAGVSLHDIVRRELVPYDVGNVEMDGPDALLTAEAAQAMAMVLHELTTNAAKHGALSHRGGRVRLHWWWLRNGSSGWLAIEWQEIGGPSVHALPQGGYGTSVIRELVPFELDGKVVLDFAPSGVRCHMEIPSECISDGGPRSQVLIRFPVNATVRNDSW